MDSEDLRWSREARDGDGGQAVGDGEGWPVAGNGMHAAAATTCCGYIIIISNRGSAVAK